MNLLAISFTHIIFAVLVWAQVKHDILPNRMEYILLLAALPHVITIILLCLRPANTSKRYWVAVIVVSVINIVSNVVVLHPHLLGSYPTGLIMIADDFLSQRSDNTENENYPIDTSKMNQLQQTMHKTIPLSQGATSACVTATLALIMKIKAGAAHYPNTDALLQIADAAHCRYDQSCKPGKVSDDGTSPMLLNLPDDSTSSTILLDSSTSSIAKNHYNCKSLYSSDVPEACNHMYAHYANNTESESLALNAYKKIDDMRNQQQLAKLGHYEIQLNSYDLDNRALLSHVKWEVGNDNQIKGYLSQGHAIGVAIASEGLYAENLVTPNFPKMKQLIYTKPTNGILDHMVVLYAITNNGTEGKTMYHIRNSWGYSYANLQCTKEALGLYKNTEFYVMNTKLTLNHVAATA